MKNQESVMIIIVFISFIVMCILGYVMQKYWPKGAVILNYCMLAIMVLIPIGGIGYYIYSVRKKA